ncbi:MAG: hypothetical protein ACFB21_04045 [Opitutales bacterium]
MKEDLAKICWSWEKLRIPFNGILIVVTIAGYLLAPTFIESGNSEVVKEVRRSFIFLIGLPFFCIGANALFLFGPLMDVYLYLLGLNKSIFRWIAFLLGTGASALVAFIITVDFSHYGVFE